MTERIDPSRADDVREANLRRRLMDRGMSVALAHQWMSAWEAEAARRAFDRGSPDYWKAGTVWILDRTSKR
jgi:hypothetical protein